VDQIDFYHRQRSRAALLYGPCKNQLENGKFDPCKIVTPENIILKLCTRDYVGEMTHHEILVSIGAVRASPLIGEVLPPCDFFDCLVHILTVLLKNKLPFYNNNHKTEYKIFTNRN